MTVASLILFKSFLLITTASFLVFFSVLARIERNSSWLITPTPALLLALLRSFGVPEYILSPAPCPSDMPLASFHSSSSSSASESLSESSSDSQSSSLSESASSSSSLSDSESSLSSSSSSSLSDSESSLSS